MKGKIIDTKTAILEIAEIPIPGSRIFQVEVKLETPVIDAMVGKTCEFTMKVPCMQFCGRQQVCSNMHDKVCEEATCTPV
ncbi:MAG: hypothetical protein WCO65_03475 [bacterium]